MTQKFNRILILLVFILFALPAISTSSKIHEILFVQSYTEQDTWSKELNEGLIKGFSENSIHANITVEYLNSRFWNWRGEEEIMRRVCKRAAERNTDLIVVANDEALYSLLVCGHSLPSEIPVVFFGIQFPNEEVLSRYPNATGLTSPVPYDVLLETAKKIFPERKNVLSLSENNALGKNSNKVFRDTWKEFHSRNPEYTLKEFDLMNDAITAVLEDIQISVDAHKSILIVPYWGLYMPSLSKVSKSPTFTACGSALFNGVFCTAAPDMYEDARGAANIASKILKGTSPSEIGITESEYELVFDYNQLKFFNVAKDRLPRNPIVMNEPYMQKYGFWIILGYVLLLGFLVVFLVRLISINRRESRKRIKAQTKLMIQNKLVAQRNEFDNVFHSIREGVITYDKDLRIHFVNRSTLRMLNLPEEVNNSGFRPYEGLQAGTVCRIHHNGKNILRSILKKVNRQGISVEIPENSFIEAIDSKVYFPVSGECVPIFANGKQTGVALTFRNISDEALQKKFFDLAIEESSIYPWQYNVEEQTFTFSIGFIMRIACNKNGKITRKELNKIIHPDDLVETNNNFNAAVDDKLTNTRLTFRLLNKEGYYEWWEFRFSIIKGLNEDIPYNIVGVSQSIQRYKTTEEELIAARDIALQADKLKTAFLANMSHEIRTPLNAIVGFSDLLKDIRSFSEEEVELFVDTINKNCILLLALINDILDLSRVESGSMDFQFAQYNLPVIMREIYESQRLNMPKNVKLIMELPENNDKTIVTDTVRLKQVINNLINNAAKFTSSGSITFGYTENEPYFTTFFVKDTGKGISQKEQERIFERFYKVDTFTQGAGLGLSICQTIIGRLGGSISVKSKEGEGSVFFVTLPNHRS